MLPDEYVEAAMRSLKKNQTQQYDLAHALMGLASETGEIAHTIKKHIIYEQPLDRKNLQEEIGDLMWYVAVACFTTGISLETAMLANIKKLMKRYPETFTPEAAMARADKAGDMEPGTYGGFKDAYTNPNDPTAE
jgi:NTP pyrophosphatase (non-canonical NTP hydrolase)